MTRQREARLGDDLCPPRRRRPGRALTTLVLAAAMVGAGLVVAPATAATCTTSTMYVGAHVDDTLLFMSPTLLRDVRTSGACVQTVFITAGDANRDQSYWAGREAGSKAAYAAMLGADNSWAEATETVEGHQVRVARLASDTGISLVFLRLPDGLWPDGNGGSRYGYQSLKKLWEGDIGQITAVDGSASYTKQGLTDTLTALMSSAQPTRIGTHDWVGQFGGDDNPDHYATGYLARAAHLAYETPHQIVSYEGYGTQNRAANVGGAELTAKSAAFYAYTPYDPAICQTPSKCSTRPESKWLAREYVVASELGGDGPPPGPDPTPTPTPTPTPSDPPPVGGSVNVAGSAVASASSSDGAQTPDRAIDGVAGGYPAAPLNEWSSLKGKVGSWLQLTWGSPQTVSKVVLYDRPNLVDQVTAGVLQFDDGSQVAVGALPNDGSPLTVTFAPRTVSGLRFTVTGVLKGTLNVGLAEIEAWTGE